MKTMKELAQQALDVQNACNLSGVGATLMRTIADIREQVPGAWNEHPIIIVLLDKMVNLATHTNIDGVSQAYSEVFALAEGRKVA